MTVGNEGALKVNAQGGETLITHIHESSPSLDSITSIMQATGNEKSLGAQQKQAKKGKIAWLTSSDPKQVSRAPSAQSLIDKGSTVFILTHYFEGFANSLLSLFISE